MDAHLSGSDQSDRDSDDDQHHSLWRDEPDLAQVRPASALNRFSFYSVTYTRDKDSNVKTVPIPPEHQRINGMPSTYNVEHIASQTIPRYRTINDNDDPDEDDPAEMNIHFKPPRPPSPPAPDHDISSSEASESVEEPQNLIPSIASLQESTIPDPPWSRDDPSKYSLKTATWPEEGKGPAHSPNSRQNRVSASSSREGEISPTGTHKRKASTDENYLSQYAAGSMRHLLPPAERSPKGIPKHRRKPYSNTGASPSRFSAMNINDDDGDASTDGYESLEEPAPAPPTTFVPRPRIIKRAPEAPAASDAEEDADFDPDEEDQLKATSSTSQVKNPKKKRKAGRFKCTEPWCKETFTRRNDVIRHLKNAAVHRSATDQGASDKRCKFCNADLSRSDARARHERAGACGKRSMPRKDYKGKRILALEAQAQAQV